MLFLKIGMVYTINGQTFFCLIVPSRRPPPPYVLDQAGNKLTNLSKKEIEVVEKLSKGIVNKMLHGPMSALRQPDGPDEKKMTLKILKDMFKLEKL